MKRRVIQVRVSCLVEVMIPADSPLLHPKAFHALKPGAEHANDYSDGRYPFAAELLHDGAQRIVDRAVHHALDVSHTAAMEMRSSRPHSREELTARNDAVAADCARHYIHVSGADDAVTVTVQVSDETREASD